MTALANAEDTLRELGITEPEEIDLEAIAWHLGAKIKFCELDGCEARIIGYKNHAIIRVEKAVSRKRKRFSIAHELGHWRYHRGRTLFCRPEDIGNSNAAQIERVADGYAADLLLPNYLFLPISQKHKSPSFDAIRNLASRFDVSLTATAIRFIKSQERPAMLTCHGSNGRKWFVRSSSMPETWFPRSELSSTSSAMDILFGPLREQQAPKPIKASAWFDHPAAQDFLISEQSIRTKKGEILTLLTTKNGKLP